MKTILERNGKTVTVEPFTQVVKGVVKTHRIKETGKSYASEKIAIKKARIELMRIALPKKDFEEKMECKRRIQIAKQIQKEVKCLQATQRYIQRWESIISVRNKKNLIEDLGVSIEGKCQNGYFNNYSEALEWLSTKIK